MSDLLDLEPEKKDEELTDPLAGYAAPSAAAAPAPPAEDGELGAVTAP